MTSIVFYKIADNAVRIRSRVPNQPNNVVSRMKKYRKKLKANTQAWNQHLSKEKERQKKNRLRLKTSAVWVEENRIKCRERARRYREKKKLEGRRSESNTGPNETNIKTEPFCDTIKTEHTSHLLTLPD
uniref:Uncharacterized protein n=1 Tax=Cacopsylla melanoneura TaxID=428564 RepID=A0A8D8M8W4_9HEMI